MSEPVLACKDLCRTYYQGGHALPVLRNLCLEVGSGESVAITGASGSGKTTLLNLLGGIDKPSSGAVFIKGQEIGGLKGRALDRLRNQTLGFVYQFHHLLGEFSAQENVAMPLIIARAPFAEALEKAAGILEQVGLKERLHHRPAQLSGGERQRVAIARALANDPVCVLMDEPTGNLDQHTAQEIHALMASLQAQLATSFVVVTHDMSFASHADRVLLLRDGALASP